MSKPEVKEEILAPPVAETPPDVVDNLSEEQEERYNKLEPPAKPEPPEGWDRVDFELIPEEHRKSFQDRFNRIYGQLKQGTRERAEERKFYQGLESKLDKFINSEEEARLEAKIELMSEKAQKLLSSGDEEDSKKGIEQLKKIVRAERDLAAKSKPVQPPATESPIAAFTEEEKAYISEFVQRNEWAGLGSPHHGLTRTTLSRFMASGISPRDAVDATEEIMNEFVKANGSAQPSERGSIAQAVLGQNRSGPGAQERGPVLNEYEQKVAIRFFPQLKPDEAYARYLRGKKE